MHLKKQHRAPANLIFEALFFTPQVKNISLEKSVTIQKVGEKVVSIYCIYIYNV